MGDLAAERPHAPTMADEHTEEYDESLVTMLELIWGEGFLAPGGADTVRHTVADTDLRDLEVLDIGCGIGGAALLLAGEMGARVTGIDLEAPLVARAGDYAARAGLSDQVTFRVVEPGPLPFPAASFDHVFTSGVLIHVEDKRAMLEDIRRVLRPGGWLLAYDWMKGEAPLSEHMHYWFEMEGLSYSMDHIGNYARFLAEAGFTDIHTEDDAGLYRDLCREEYAQLRGPLYERMSALLGPTKRDHFIEDWRSMTVVLDRGELRPGWFRARNPV